MNFDMTSPDTLLLLTSKQQQANVQSEIQKHKFDLSEIDDKLSVQTITQNDSISGQLQKTNALYAFRMEQDLKYNFYKKQDTKQMIKKFNTECLTLNYQLERLVSNNDSHRILQPKKPLTVEVLANTYMYFKVVTKDMLAPGKVHFSYAEGTYVRNARRNVLNSNPNKTKVELTVYFSVDEKNKEPSKEVNDKFIESPLGTI